MSTDRNTPHPVEQLARELVWCWRSAHDRRYTDQEKEEYDTKFSGMSLVARIFGYGDVVKIQRATRKIMEDNPEPDALYELDSKGFWDETVVLPWEEKCVAALVTELNSMWSKPTQETDK